MLGLAMLSLSQVNLTIFQQIKRFNSRMNKIMTYEGHLKNITIFKINFINYRLANPHIHTRGLEFFNFYVILCANSH